MRPGKAKQSAPGYLAARGLAGAAKVTVATLHTHATYATPSGRLCRLLPNADLESGHDSFGVYYLDEVRGRPISDLGQRDGFRLRAVNVGLLREVCR